MSSRLTASIAALVAGAGLSACGCSSKTTLTETVTTTVSGANAAAPTSRGATSAHGKTASSGAGTGATGASSSSPTQSGGTGSSGGTGGGSAQPTSSGQANASALTKHLVDNTENVHITSHQGAIIVQEGVVTGSPIGNGSVVMRNRLTGSGVITTFTVKGSEGSFRGLGNAVLQVQGSTVRYRGTARIIAGTGRYSRVRAPHLTVVGSGSLSGDTTLHVTGVEWY
jgi:hypothetical protein